MQLHTAGPSDSTSAGYAHESSDLYDKISEDVFVPRKNGLKGAGFGSESPTTVPNAPKLRKVTSPGKLLKLLNL